MDLFLIRHTPPAGVDGLCYGRLEVSLPPSADDDIRATLARLPRMDGIFSSSSQRCLRLAAAIARRDACPLTQAPALQELDFGAWEGLSWQQIPRHESDPWALDPWHRSPPGGETEQALWQRVSAWHDQTLPHCTGRQAIVGHAGSLRLLRCLILRLPIEQRWSWRIGWGEIVRLQSAA